MIKKTLGSLGWLALLLPFMCMGIAHATLIHSQNSDVRKIADFNKIQSNGNFQVHVQLGNQETIRLEGNQEMLNQVETVVDNHTLIIRMKKNFHWFSINKERINVYITAKQLNGLAQSGSGLITVEGTMKGTTLETEVSGSGTITCTVQVHDFEASVSGSGKVDVNGRVVNSAVHISGSGKLNGTKLSVDHGEVNISGSGRAYLTINQSLDAHISGSGQVLYSGSVKSINAHTSGSGKVQRM